MIDLVKVKNKKLSKDAEYRTTFVIDGEVYEAIRKHDINLQKLVRELLSDFVKTLGEKK